MTIRTILVGASGGTATGGAVELACRLAKRFGAYLEGYHVKIDPNDLVVAAAAAGVGMPADAGLIDTMVTDAESLSADTKAAFLKTTARYDLAERGEQPPTASCAGWRDQVGPATGLIAARARFFDLVVLGRSDRVVDDVGSDVIEGTLMESGRPVLLAPETPPAIFGETIVIGWDGSARSVHAVAAAMPLLREAKRIVVVTVGDKPDADAPALGEHLRCHGLACEIEAVAHIAGVDAGEQLLSSARDAGADLLVMGAFGHAPWREALFGGATRTVVDSSLLPVLLTH
jgi:nucleotide-binding universal stress UspA family protein